MFKTQHLDAADTVWFNRQLESVDQQDYTELLPGNLARRYIPDAANVDEWADAYTYTMYKLVGKARISGKNSDAASRATLTGKQTTRNIKPIENSYGWTVREIQKAAGTRTPLDQMTVLAARSAMDREIDSLLALGSAEHGIEGLLSLSDVNPANTTPTVKTSGTTWAEPTNTPDQILADINKITAYLFQALKQSDAPAFQKFTLLVPTDAYARIATTARSSTSDTTILQFAIANNPWIESIEPWYHCDDAGVGDVGRMVAYPRNPLALGGLVPQEFRSLAPQERNTEIVVPCLAACGGTVARYTVAFAYMDGV